MPRLLAIFDYIAVNIYYIYSGASFSFEALLLIYVRHSPPHLPPHFYVIMLMNGLLLGRRHFIGMTAISHG